MRKKEVYNIVNTIFLIGAFISLSSIFISELDDFRNFLNSNNIVFVIVFIMFFLLIHMVKLIRFYLILVDANMRIGRFIKTYIKTTYVNILLPFKSGELFRIFCYTNETADYKVGILSILVERFFDTLGLIVLLIPIEFYTIHKLSISTLILFGFTVSLLYVYLTFQGFYDYINRFLIFNVSGRKSINGLKILERLYEWYQYIRKLISRRAIFIFGLSLAVWVMELVMFYLLSVLLNRSFTLEVFSGYLNAALTGGSAPLLTMYQVGASVLFAIIVTLVYLPVRKRRIENA
jgi:hypothetical protein